MKMKAKIIIMGIATLALLTFAAGSLQAQVTQLLTITAKAKVQNPNPPVVVGNVTTTLAPTTVSVTTKQILSALASAEFSEGHLVSPTFPVGAKLVVLTSNANPPDFQVLDAQNQLIVEVSDIISAQNTGQFGSKVSSGKQNDVTGLSSPTKTDLKIFTISYDDTAIFGSQHIQFYLTGLMTSVTTDTVPNISTGAYTETKSDKMTDGAGDGNSQGSSIVLTGTVSAAGKATLFLP